MKKQGDRIFAASILLGLSVGIGSTAVLTLIFAAVITAAPASLRASGALATAALVLGSFLSGFFSAFKHRKKGMLTGAVTGLIYYIVLVALSLLLLRSVTSSSVFIKLAVITVSSSLGGIFGVNFKLGRRVL